MADVCHFRRRLLLAAQQPSLCAFDFHLCIIDGLELYCLVLHWDWVHGGGGGTGGLFQLALGLY